MQPEHEDSNPMWIESHQSLGRHPKTKRLARKLGIVLPSAIGHLHLLWWWALDYAPDGDITKYDAAELAEECAWTDDPDTFLAALTESGFVDRIDGKTVIHDWDDYAGKLIDQRGRNAERMRVAREKERINKEEARAAHVTSTLSARAGLPYLTGPNQPDLTKPTEPKNEQPSAACAADLFDEFAGRIAMDGANAGAVLADAVSNQYGIDCRDFGRLGALAKAHTPTAVLDRIFGLTATWSGKGNPVNYIIAAMNGSAKDRKNGNGHSAEKLPTNHQPADLPEVIDGDDLDSDEIKRQEDEKDRIAFEKRAARLVAEKQNGRPSLPAIFAVGTER